MNDDTEYNETPPHSKWRGLKIIAICIVVLAIFVPVFGHIVPKLLFAPEKIAEKSPEKIVENPTTEPQKPEQPITPNAPLTTSPLQGEERLQSLEGKITKLEDEIAVLKADLEAKTSQNAEISKKADNKVAIMVAFGQLHEAIYHGSAYNSQLEQLKNLTGLEQNVQEIIAKLEQNSQAGITLEPDLTKQFEPLVKQVMTAQNPSWVKNAAQKLVIIRRIGKQDGADDESILARAEENLNANQPALDKAVAELEKLSPSAKQVFAPWIASANNTLETKNNLYKLQTTLAKNSQNQP